MSNEPSDKYKQFLNYMTNELGITRQDIQAWSQQAVANEVEKLVGQMNLDKQINSAVADSARRHIESGTYGQPSKMQQAIALQMASKIKITIEP